MIWCVAQTQAGREASTQARIAELGLETYLPRFKIHERPVALWPGYLIVQAIPQWSLVRWTPGVVRLVMAGDRPASLAAEVVLELRRRENREGLIRMPKEPSLQRGQRVRVTTGPCAGLIGLYQGQQGPARVRILLQILGQETAVTLAARAVEPVRLAKSASVGYKP